MRKDGVAEFIADVETLSVIPDSKAKVVINQGQPNEQKNRVMELQGNATSESWSTGSTPSVPLRRTW